MLRGECNILGPMTTDFSFYRTGIVKSFYILMAETGKISKQVGKNPLSRINVIAMSLKCHIARCLKNISSEILKIYNYYLPEKILATRPEGSCSATALSSEGVWQMWQIWKESCPPVISVHFDLVISVSCRKILTGFGERAYFQMQLRCWETQNPCWNQCLVQARVWHWGCVSTDSCPKWTPL